MYPSPSSRSALRRTSRSRTRLSANDSNMAKGVNMSSRIVQLTANSMAIDGPSGSFSDSAVQTPSPQGCKSTGAVRSSDETLLKAKCKSETDTRNPPRVWAMSTHPRSIR